MKLRVGQVLTMGGQDWLVTSLCRSEETCLLSLSGLQLREERSTLQNVKHINLEIGSFEAHSIVDFETEYVELKQPGKNVFYIYTKYKVVKHTEEENGQVREEGAPQQTTDRAPESVE